jgi:NADH-quinone oxidoreductase subunit N
MVNFHGLGKLIRYAILTASLLSMAGIPILQVSLLNYFLFNNMLQAGFIALVIVAVINSIISVGYYFKVILAMYTKEPNEERPGTPVVIRSCRYSDST